MERLVRAARTNAQDFEIIELKMSNQFQEKCKIADVRKPEALRNTITGDMVVNIAVVHPDDIRDSFKYSIRNILK